MLFALKLIPNATSQWRVASPSRRNCFSICLVVNLFCLASITFFLLLCLFSSVFLCAFAKEAIFSFSYFGGKLPSRCCRSRPRLHMDFPCPSSPPVLSLRASTVINWNPSSRGELVTASDLAALRLSMIAPVKKSVNHSRTVASMREMGREQHQKEVRLRSDSTVGSEFAFAPVGHCFLCCNQFLSAVINVELTFSFFWSCVCHYMRITTLKTRPVNIDRKHTLILFLDARSFDSLHLSRCRLPSCVSV